MKPDAGFTFDRVSKVKAGGLCFGTENPVRGVRACSNASSFNAAGVGSCLLATTGTGTTIPATGSNARRRKAQP